MTVVDTHPTVDIDVDLDATPTCQAIECDTDNESPAIAVSVNWCGCQILLCELCTRQQASTMLILVEPALYTCRMCSTPKYGVVADLCRIVPL